MLSTIPNLKPTPAARFVALDPQQPDVVLRGRGDAQSVMYKQASIPMSTSSAKVVTLCSFVANLGSYNIVDFSANQGLQNNVLTVNGNLIVVPPGNYDATNLASTLQTLIAAVVPGTTVTYNSITYRFTFTNAAPLTLTFGSSQTMAFELGFPDAYSAVNLSHTSVFNCNLSGPPNVYININEIPSSNVIFYDQTPFTFSFPLTQQSPNLSQLTMINTPKLQCILYSGLGPTSSLTVSLYFTRNGAVYPFYVPGSVTVGECIGQYEMILAFE